MASESTFLSGRCWSFDLFGAAVTFVNNLIRQSRWHGKRVLTAVHVRRRRGNVTANARGQEMALALDCAR